MKRHIAAVAACVLLLAGCDSDGVKVGSPTGMASVKRIHDAEKSVTCWTINDKAIDCIPDSQLRSEVAR